jgi:predicted extracellular nuclease
LIDALKALDADILALVEIENNGDAPTPAIAELTQRLNAALGSSSYGYVDTGTIGTDAITVGIIYRVASVEPIGVTAVLEDAAFVDPNGTGMQRNRPALAQAFEVAGERGAKRAFTLVVNHFKSKGADDATGLDADQLDGQSAWNDTRTKAAEYLVRNWLPSNPTGTGDSDILIVGDLNAYRGEAPLTVLRNAGYRDLHQVLLCLRWTARILGSRARQSLNESASRLSFVLAHQRGRSSGVRLQRHRARRGRGDVRSGADRQ